MKKLQLSKENTAIKKLRRLASDNTPIDSELALMVLDDLSLDLTQLLEIASKPRQYYFAKKIQIHIINNLRNGYCPEDCSYCAQRKNLAEDNVAKESIFRYTDKTEDEVLKEAKHAWESGAYRYCLVSAGRGPNKKSLDYYLRLIKKIKENYPKMELCLSAGLLKNLADTKRLAEAGLNRYNHNLNTSPDNYSKICTTHTYQDRILTLELLQSAGISLCSGLIAGLGENSSDLVHLALELAKRKVASIPVNFFLPVQGNTVEQNEFLKKLEPDFCLRILCMLRLTNPQAEIRLAAGRELYLGERQSEALAVANSLFVDGYLNVQGSDLAETTKLIENLGYEIESYYTGGSSIKKDIDNSEEADTHDIIPALKIKTKEQLRPFHEENSLLSSLQTKK